MPSSKLSEHGSRAFESVSICHESDVCLLVLQVQHAAQHLGFNVVMATQLSTVASELAMNIVKYAGRGDVSWGQCEGAGRSGFELWAIDQGPGMADVALALSEHYSSRGTLGLGLPGTRRLVDEFSIDSQPGKGTRICIRKWLRR
ncbi:anti-sigma regulatory factor [Neisseriaceae bacterium TC5R-5]|nr:anti-sigma regulatory factor [Neisseriaceae bacterium TC5R-5]